MYRVPLGPHVEKFPYSQEYSGIHILFWEFTGLLETALFQCHAVVISPPSASGHKAAHATKMHGPRELSASKNSFNTMPSDGDKLALSIESSSTYMGTEVACKGFQSSGLQMKKSG